MSRSLAFGTVLRGERDDVHMVLGVLRTGGYISVVTLKSETGDTTIIGSVRRYQPGKFYLLDWKWHYEVVE